MHVRSFAPAIRRATTWALTLVLALLTSLAAVRRVLRRLEGAMEVGTAAPCTWLFRLSWSCGPGGAAPPCGSGGTATGRTHSHEINQ